jgi:hypothetical protein
VRRRLALLAAVAACGVAAPAVAQSSQVGANGLRYLSWPGKGAAPAPAPRAAAPETVTAVAATPPADAPAARTLRPPSARLIARAPMAEAPRPGLTPASAWLPPREAPPAVYPAPVETAYAPPPARAPAREVVREAAPAPVPASEYAPPPAPIPEPVREIAREAAPLREAPPAADPAYDPMAPRRDAPIFRLQRPNAEAAAPQPSAPQASAPPAEYAPQPAVQPEPQAGQQPRVIAGAAGQGSRYYSLHRQAGRQPDSVPTPPPVYLDALPVQLDETPSSGDLAAPPEPPSMYRDAQGRVRATPQVEADPLP